MAICEKCKEFYPPDFMEDGLPGDKICIFCKRDVTEITGRGKTITKKEVVKDYKIFIKKLKETRNVKDILDKAIGD